MINNGYHRIRPKFGQKVRITHVAERGNSYQWVERRIISQEGIYIGYRTKFNGHVITEDYGSKYFIPDESVRVWMVILNERQKPVPVFPPHVEIIDNE